MKHVFFDRDSLPLNLSCHHSCVIFHRSINQIVKMRKIKIKIKYTTKLYLIFDNQQSYIIKGWIFHYHWLCTTTTRWWPSNVHHLCTMVEGEFWRWRRHADNQILLWRNRLCYACKISCSIKQLLILLLFPLFNSITDFSKFLSF